MSTESDKNLIIYKGIASLSRGLTKECDATIVSDLRLVAEIHEESRRFPAVGIRVLPSSRSIRRQRYPLVGTQRPVMPGEIFRGEV